MSSASVKDCLMCGGTGKALDSQNEFYLKLLRWYTESGGKVPAKEKGT